MHPGWVSTAEGGIATCRAVRGDPVLPVHGGEGHAGDLGALAHTLRGHGFALLAIDLPAHGRSDGTETSVEAAARALLEVQRQTGPTRAVVAHSIGAAVAVHAMALRGR